MQTKNLISRHDSDIIQMLFYETERESLLLYNLSLLIPGVMNRRYISE